MPGQFPSSFASAAAGNLNQDPSSNRTSRVDGTGSGEWSRSRPNGTATFSLRRPSSTTTSLQQQPSTIQSANPPTSSGVYVPPHHYQNSTNRNGQNSESRYSKDIMLSIFKSQKEAGDLGKNLSGLFMDGWNPENAHRSTNQSWSKRDEPGREGNNPGPEVCWEFRGSVLPLGLSQLSEDERELFSSSVNSPLKQSQQGGKDQASQNSGSLNRKTSLSQVQNLPSSYGLVSPTMNRPGNRRRDTSDALPDSGNPLSPSGGGRFFRDDPNPHSPPPALLRRRTDVKDSFGAETEDREVDTIARLNNQDSKNNFSNMARRSATNPLSAGPNGPSSPWSTTPQSATFSPMGQIGAFGSLLSGSQAPLGTTGEKRPAFGSVRGESRFSKMMASKESSEDMSSLSKQSSLGNLGLSNEGPKDRSSQSWRASNRSNRGMSSVTDPFGGDDEVPSGSAALGGQNVSPPLPQGTGVGTSSRKYSRDDFGPSEVGMSSSDMPAFREMIAQRHDPTQSQSQHVTGGQEPLSPTETNPYQSPAAEKADSEDIDTDDSEAHNMQHPGLRGLSGDSALGGSFGPYSRGVINTHEVSAGDRSQTSSAGPGRGFSGLGGLGGLSGLSGMPGWSTTANPMGTPDRERPNFPTPFGNSVFGTMGDLQSPSLAGSMFGSNPGINSTAPGAVNRGSKLGSLFPSAMQAQMQGHEPGSIEGHAATEGQRNSVGAFGTSAPGLSYQGRDTESPMRIGRGMFDDLNFSSLDINRNSHGSDNSFTRNETSAPYSQQRVSGASQTPSSGTSVQQDIPIPQSANPQSSHQQQASQTSGSGGAQSNQPPTSQQRTMVMPDRIRWIYKDTLGNTQGPWSGLEMHDWYKAGFFTPDLMVKKYEDNEYEPLGQLIRRIGNSREPFLVPQIGIPHGPASTQPASQWASASTSTTPAQPAGQSGSVQPPFAGAFPSFGTTLTAEQQNALERRKQEEQYLMARQKEYLAQQQVMQKHQMLSGGPHSISAQQLHHHSSAHSLHSQPSFGSITSPGGFQPTPPQGPIQGQQAVPPFLEAQMRQSSGMGVNNLASGSGDFYVGNTIPEEDIPAAISRLNPGRDAQQGTKTLPFGQSQQEMPHHSQAMAAILAQRNQLQWEQHQHDASHASPLGEHESFSERLQQFRGLRAGMDEEHAYMSTDGLVGKPGAAQGTQPYTQNEQIQFQRRSQGEGENQGAVQSTTADADKHPEPLSLAQQVQKAASAKDAPIPMSPWGKIDNIALPQPFPPPPQSASPLPAPTAQRSRQNLSDTLHAETRSRSQTPSVDTPSASIAPWAKESAEGSKGPSLKEIQEAEARKAAKAEEAAAAARRAVLEQERLILAQPPAPGLPSTSTWGNAMSPLNSATSGPSAWNKPLAGKANVTHSGPPTKKTLSQIQKEEELRKQKVAQANLAATQGQSAVTGGKRYADLASKTAVPMNPGGAWTTVGTGGAKPKAALSSAAPITTPSYRTVSTSTAPVLSTAAKPRPAAGSTRSATMGGPTLGQSNAKEELAKWAKNTLTGRMNQSINVESFVQQLLIFPSELDIIKEAVHGNSETVNAQHFAEEFIRRRKLADKGLIDNTSTPSPGGEEKNDGGWSAVAKKGSTNAAANQSEMNAAFRVVTTKKRGKK